MNTRQDIYNLLYHALTQIRTDALRAGSRSIGDVADLFHSIPLDLEQAAQGNATYEAILLRLRTNARRSGIHGWLNSTITDQESRYSKDPQQMLHRLLYIALIDIRMRAHEAHEEHVFCIADAFHNVPLVVLQALQGRESYERILAAIRDRTRTGRCESWLDQAIKAIPPSSPCPNQR